MKPTARVVLSEPIEPLPDEAACMAAVVRQLFLARNTGDEVVAWLAVNDVCSRLTRILGDLLSVDALWDADKRWIDHIARREVLVERPECIRVTGPMLWGLAEDVGGRQWAEPFAADLLFQPGFSRLNRYTIRFADRRLVGNETLRESFPRIVTDIENNVIEWKYEFSRTF
jgi:hypothetical protein